MSLIRFSASTAACLRGRNGLTLWFRGWVATGHVRSHDSSNGYNCWTARSKILLPVRTLTARTNPSFPTIRLSATARGQQFLLRSLDLIITTSPTESLLPVSQCFRRCRLRRARKYSVVQRLHMASLHFCKNFARFFKSFSSRW
jgi:hypothetical protein